MKVQTVDVAPYRELRSRYDELYELADDMLDELRCICNSMDVAPQSVAAYAERLDSLHAEEPAR